METVAARLAAADPQFSRGCVRSSYIRSSTSSWEKSDPRSSCCSRQQAVSCSLVRPTSPICFSFGAWGAEREMAVRTAIGATRTRLASELLTEAATLSVAAGALGIAAAFIGVRILRSLAPPAFPRLNDVGVDARVVAFCAFSLRRDGV